MKKGELTTKVIGSTTQSYNSIAVQAKNNIYYDIKEASKEEIVQWFINLLIKQLKLNLNKKQLETRTVFL